MTQYNRLRVLVADFAGDTQFQVITQLRQLGVSTIETADSRTSAWDHLVNDNPNLLIICMGQKDGGELDTVFELRRSPKVNNFCPIIVIARSPDPAFVRKAIDAGVNEILVRPFTPEGLAGRLKSIFSHPLPFVRSQTFVGPNRRRRQVSVPQYRRQDDIKARLKRSNIRIIGISSAKDWKG